MRLASEESNLLASRPLLWVGWGPLQSLWSVTALGTGLPPHPPSLFPNLHPNHHSELASHNSTVVLGMQEDLRKCH